MWGHIVSNDDWFRLPCLTEEARDQFEQRLSRSRSSRPEYLRLQAYALREAGHYEQAIQLIDRVLKDHPNHLDAWLYEERASSQNGLGNVQAAIDDYVRSILAMRADLGLRGSAPIKLAQLVCETKRADLYEACLEYLTEFWDKSPIFPRWELHQFGWTAVLLYTLGQTEDAKPPARRALAAAAKTRSNAANHRGLGLVNANDLPLVTRLEKIIGVQPAFKSRVDARGLVERLKGLFQ